MSFLTFNFFINKFFFLLPMSDYFSELKDYDKGLIEIISYILLLVFAILMQKFVYSWDYDILFKKYKVLNIFHCIFLFANMAFIAIIPVVAIVTKLNIYFAIFGFVIEMLMVGILICLRRYFKSIENNFNCLSLNSNNLDIKTEERISTIDKISLKISNDFDSNFKEENIN